MTLTGSALSPEARSGAFHGIDRECTLKEEKPYHRQAAYMLALNADTGDVAKALDVTPHAVRSWLREPWFQERVAQIQAERGKDLTQLFINEAWSTFATMVELRDDIETPATVRAGICRDILDRALGKPVAHVKVEGTQSVADPVAEAERLEAENLKLLQR